MGKKRKMPGLNTSSTADISFMLLIFPCDNINGHRPGFGSYIAQTT